MTRCNRFNQVQSREIRCYIVERLGRDTIYLRGSDEMTLRPRKRSRHEEDSRRVRVGASNKIEWGGKEEISERRQKRRRRYMIAGEGGCVCVRFGRLSFQTRGT